MHLILPFILREALRAQGRASPVDDARSKRLNLRAESKCDDQGHRRCHGKNNFLKASSRRAAFGSFSNYCFQLSF